MTDLAALHPELALMGLGAGALATGVRRWLPISPADAAAVVVVGVLGAQGQVPAMVVAAVALLAVAAALPQAPQLALSALAAVGLAAARDGLTTSLLLTLVAGLAVALVPPHQRDPMRASWTRAVLLPAALVAGILGGPDTEAVVALAATCLIPLVAATFVAHVGPAPLALWGAVAFASADAYRGRPGGVGGAIVVVGGLAALRLLQLKADPRKQMSRQSIRAPMPLPVTMVAACGTMWVSARTLGMAGSTTPKELAGSVVLAVGLGALGAISETPVPVHRRRA